MYTERRGAVQGPEGIVSSKTIASVQMILQSTRELKTSINYINPQFLEHVNPSAMLNLVVELVRSVGVENHQNRDKLRKSMKLGTNVP